MSQSTEDDNGFPDLTLNSSVMAACLRADPKLYSQYENIRTSGGYGFDSHIQIGVDNAYGNGSGCCCLEEDSYKCFYEFYHTLICICQAKNEPIRSSVCHRLNVLNLEDYRYSIDYNYIKDVQVQTRRNISGFRFSPECSRAERRKIFNLVNEAFQLQYPEGPSLTHLYDISMEQKRKLHAVGEVLEKPEGDSVCGRSGGTRDWPDGRGVIFLPDTSISIWVNEEDSIRIFARDIGDSTNIVNVLEKVSDCEVYLEKYLCEIGGWSYAYNSHFGYLTTDPTKLGVLEIKITIETIAIYGDKMIKILGLLCDKYQINFIYDINDHHNRQINKINKINEAKNESRNEYKNETKNEYENNEINSNNNNNNNNDNNDEKKGIKFDLITRSDVFSSEDDRVGRFLECVKSIIRFDEYINLHGFSENDQFIQEMIVAPVECNWRDVRSDSLQSSGRGSGSILSPRGAMSLLSVISPRRWSLRSNNKDKVRVAILRHILLFSFFPFFSCLVRYWWLLSNVFYSLPLSFSPIFSRVFSSLCLHRIWNQV